MRHTHRGILYKSFFATVLLFTIYGCQTTNNTVETPEKPADSERKRMELAYNRLGVLLGGHGGGREISKTDAKGPSEDPAVASKLPKVRPFGALEKKLYGKWINIKETESYDFHNDGSVVIVVTGKRKDRTQTLKGHFILVKKSRIEFDFKGGPYAKVVPTRHFKISISGDEFTLTDEPIRSGGPDGPTTIYKRVR